MAEGEQDDGPHAGVADAAALHARAVIAELEQRVAQRRASGEYPDDVASRFAQQFQRMLDEQAPDLDLGPELLDALRATPHLTPDRIVVDSGVPGGAIAHRTTARLVSRQTAGVLDQVQLFADRIVPVVEQLHRAIDGHVRRSLVRSAERFDALLDVAVEQQREIARLDTRVRQLEDLHEGIQAELVEVRAVLADVRATRPAPTPAAPAATFSPHYSSRRFDDVFRGDRETIRDRYVDLADLLAPHAPVVDVGCGRGELVELLVERGADVRGVELDPELASWCRAQGLPVEHGDGLAALLAAPDASLGGVVALQVVEHLGPQGVCDLLVESARALRPGGLLVAETVNPSALRVFAASFYCDPTHTQPIHAAYLRFAAAEAGFADVQVQYRSPLDPSERMLAPHDGTDPEAHDRALVDDLLFGAQDYAIIATR